MNKLTLLKELLLRLQAESPDFFKKIKKYSIYLAALIFAVLAGEWVKLYTLPAEASLALFGALNYFLGTGTTASLPAKNPEELTESKYKQ